MDGNFTTFYPRPRLRLPNVECLLNVLEAYVDGEAQRNLLVEWYQATAASIEKRSPGSTDTAKWIELEMRLTYAIHTGFCQGQWPWQPPITKAND